MVLRVGLIGCGEHSEIGHAVPWTRYAAERPGAIELAAVCDMRLERAEFFCRKYGFARSYRALDEMLAREKLDVCISVVPVELIPQVGIRLLQANLPCVVVEKPLGPSLSEVRKLTEAARTTKTTNMVSVNRRFMPFLKRALEWARNAGTLQYVHATMLRHQRTEADFLRYTAIHALDTVRFIAGEFSSLTIQALTPSSPRSYAIDVKFASGAAGRVDVLPVAGVVEETYELTGDGFRAVVTSPFGPQRLVRCYQRNQLVLEEMDANISEDVIFGFYGEVAELVDAMVQLRPPQPSIEDVFPSVQACFELAERMEVSKYMGARIGPQT
ncbi:MAG TPA: Gfo/Idh/MocA family oxidoreductase [Terriglobales bacterium]|nr:Gfo/Idh/MocA family oxidoreductase [Terriglobales bacterium]